MSAPRAGTWDEVPAAVQEQVRLLYGALLQGAIEEDDDRTGKDGHPGRYEQSSRLYQWDYLPERMRLSMANMLMAQRHETNRTITATLQATLQDVVRSRT